MCVDKWLSLIRHMRAKKRFGQHFLQAAWADKLVDAIAPRSDDRFIEIGPGPGALTVRLAPRVAYLTAIELDPEMVAHLRPQVPANVTLVEQDFLDADVESLLAGGPVRVAGNLPYNVSSPILFKLLDAQRSFRLKAEATGRSPLTDATLMLQKEVADRILAPPGTKDYGVLSVFVQLHADVKRLLSLPPGAFRPAPKVHSAVIQLRFRPAKVEIADQATFDGMVRSVFTQRRKTLANALKPFAEARGASAAEALAASGIDPSRRAETLQLTEFARLAATFR